MSIIARKTKGGEFIPAPEGLWPGVCCDVVDMGMTPTPWGMKHKVQIRWLVDAKPSRQDNKPHMVSKKYTLSLHEKANLRQMLEVWRNRKFSDDELEGFDLDSLVGVACQIQVAQAQGDDGPYSFPQVVLKAANAASRVHIPTDYVRAKDRPDYKAPVLPEEEVYEDEISDDEAEISDDDMPF